MIPQLPVTPASPAFHCTIRKQSTSVASTGCQLDRTTDTAHGNSIAGTARTSVAQLIATPFSPALNCSSRIESACVISPRTDFSPEGQGNVVTVMVGNITGAVLEPSINGY